MNCDLNLSTKKILVGSEVGVIYEASIEAEKEKFKQVCLWLSFQIVVK